MRTALLLALLFASAPARAAAPADPTKEAREAEQAKEADESPLPPPGEGLAGDVNGEGKPPPGTPEDQALWAEGLDVSQRITGERYLASKLQWEARADRHGERLAELARKSSGSAAARAEELRQRYLAALALNYQTLARRWPVDPTRGCGYSMLYLASAMRTGKADELAVMRPPVRTCVAKARPAVEVMAASNAELQRLAAEAAALLSPPPGEAGKVAKD